jgi:O-antigen/teichoic acid export membrane protein
MPGTQGKDETQAPRLSRGAKVIFLTIGNGMALIAGLIGSMVAARYLSKADYGTVRQTFLVYEFIAPILLLGLPNALYYFLPRNGEDRRGQVIDNAALLLGLGLAFSLFIMLGGAGLLADRFDNPRLRETLPWLALYAPMMTFLAGLPAVLVISERVRTLTIFSTLSSLGIAFGSIAAVLATRSYEWPVYARIIVPALSLPLAVVLIIRAMPGEMRWPRADTMHRMLRYSVPLGLATILGTITMQLHAVIVAAMTTPEEFAVYINGAIEIPIIGLIVGSITTITFADMSAACAREETGEALAIFRIAAIKSAVLLFPAACYTAVAAEPFIVFLYSDAYRESVVPFLIYLIALPVRIVVYGAAMMALGMTREILFRSVFDLVINAVLCVVFVSWLGYAGAAIGLVVTLYLWTVPFNLYKLAQGFGVGWRKLLPFSALGVVLGLSLVPVPLAILVLRATADQPVIAQLVASWLAYCIVAGPVLVRSGYLTVPATIATRTPAPLRRLLRM